MLGGDAAARTPPARLSLQKKTLIACEQTRPDVADARRRWRRARGGFRAGRLVFLDETWAKTNMTPTRGWAPRGRRLLASVPHGHWRTTTFLCGLRADGPVAPLVVDGAIDGPLFLAWVRQHLCPVLRRGDVVVMDNLSAHKVAGVAEAIRAVGAKARYLPPYSPDLNPIELLFSKLKRLIRAAGERTVEGLWRRIGELLDRFPPSECRNYLRHCGYTRYA
nr:IS630 family transposase [Alienimonas californiensis]